MRTVLTLLVVVVAALAVILALSRGWSVGGQDPTPTTEVSNLAVRDWLAAIPNNPAVTAIIAGIFGLAGGFLSAFLKIRYDLRGEYDKDLRNQRLVAYQALWKELQPLAFYSPPAPVTYKTVSDLSAALRQWYYEVGGLFLSSNPSLFSAVRYRRALREFRRTGTSGQEPRPADYERGSRAAYFAVQGALQSVIEKSPKDRDLSKVELAPDDLKTLKGLASTLRTSLTEDIGTRRTPWLAGG
jgi:hypothetical protein